MKTKPFADTEDLDPLKKNPEKIYLRSKNVSQEELEETLEKKKDVKQEKVK